MAIIEEQVSEIENANVAGAAEELKVAPESKSQSHVSESIAGDDLEVGRMPSGLLSGSNNLSTPLLASSHEQKQNGESSSWSFKEAVVTGADMFNRAFCIVGPIINALMVFDAAMIQEHSCDTQTGSIANDYAKLIEYGMLIGLCVLQLVVVNVVKAVAKKRESEQQEKLLEQHENVLTIVDEVADATESFVFRYNVVKMLGGSPTAAVFASARTVWPIVCLLMGWERGSFDLHKKRDGNTWLARVKAAGEALYNGESLSSAVTTASLLIQSVALSPYQNTGTASYQAMTQDIIKYTWCVGELFGVASVLHPKTWKVARFVEGAVNSFYYVFSGATAQIACSVPQLMNGVGFSQHGQAICTLVGGVAAINAARAGVFTAGYLSQDVDEEPGHQQDQNGHDSHGSEEHIVEQESFSTDYGSMSDRNSQGDYGELVEVCADGSVEATKEDDVVLEFSGSDGDSSEGDSSEGEYDTGESKLVREDGNRNLLAGSTSRSSSLSFSSARFFRHVPLSASAPEPNHMPVVEQEMRSMSWHS